MNRHSAPQFVNVTQHLFTQQNC